MLRLKLLLLLFFVLFSQLQSEVIDLKVSLKNGTTGGIGKADTIKIITLHGGMGSIGELQNKQGKIVFEKINVPDDSPILIQVSFKGANYNKMVPPTPAIRNKEQEIIVYDTTSDSKNINIKNLLQIIREENAIRIFKIFLVNNETNPPQSYIDEKNPLDIYIPSDAQEIRGQLNQGDSKMGIPLTLKDGKKGKIIDRPLLPGNSEIQISYTLSAKSLADISFKDEFSIEDKKIPQIILFKPKDMKVSVKGATEVKDIKENIPHQLGALSVFYPANSSIEISVSGGSADQEVGEEMNSSNSRQVKNGTIFTSWDRSLLAVIGFLAMFFSFSAIVFYRK